MSFRPNQPLYHGTNNIYSDIICQHGVRIFDRKKGGVDFGPAFYLTSNFQQAKKWANRRYEKPIPNPEALELNSMTIRDFYGVKDDLKPVVLKFGIKNQEIWESYNYKVFEYAKDDWKSFVWNMRHANTPLQQYNYDWIFGPVADGGILSTDYKEIEAYTNMDQIALLTKRAIKCIKLSEVIPC